MLIMNTNKQKHTNHNKILFHFLLMSLLNLCDIKVSISQITQMDNLQYNYTSNTNQLNFVKDDVSAANFTIDIDSQMVDNYAYDKIGNITKDQQEGILEIK